MKCIKIFLCFEKWLLKSVFVFPLFRSSFKLSEFLLFMPHTKPFCKVPCNSRCLRSESPEFLPSHPTSSLREGPQSLGGFRRPRPPLRSWVLPGWSGFLGWPCSGCHDTRESLKIIFVKLVRLSWAR